MKPRILSAARLSYPLAAALAALLTATSSHAVDFWWDGGTANWSTNTAWSTVSTAATPDPASAPSSATTSDLFFNRTGINTSNVISLAGGNRTARSMTFNNTGTNVFRANASGTTTARTLTIGAGGITINAGAGAVTIGESPGTYGTINVALASDQTWTNNSANGLSLAGAVSGTGFNLVKTGSAAIRLNGANTLTGSLEVTEGLLQIGNYAGLDTVSSLKISGGGSSNLQIIQVGTGTTANTIVKNLSLHGTLSTGGGSGSNILNLAWDGNITLGGASTITNNGNATIDINGQVDLGEHALTYRSDRAGSRIDGAIIGTGGSLTKTGAHDLRLTATNSYTGTTTISTGTLILANANTLGTTPGVDGTSGISMDADSILQSGTAAGSNTTVAAPITLSGSGNSNFRIGTGAAGVTTSFVFDGAIGGTTGNVVFSTTSGSFGNGSSQFVLNAANTYTGNTLITTGNGANNPVFVKNGIANALPTSTVLSFGQVVGGGSGRLFQYDLNGFNQTLAGLDNGGVVPSLRNMQVTSSEPAVLTINGSTNSIFGGRTTTTSTTRAQIIGAIALTKNGTGTFTLGGTLEGGATAPGNTFTGDTTVLGGILVLGESISIQNSAYDTGASIVGDATNGLQVGIGGAGVTSLTLGGLKGDKNFADVFTTTNGGYSNLTGLTLNPGVSVTNSYSGNIGDGAGAMTLTKSGSGTQILSGVNTYSGATTISAGTLALGASGTIASSPLVDVSGGAIFDVSAAGFILGSGKTLQGSGSVLGAVTASTGTIITAGNGTTGTLTLQDLTLSGTATLNIGALNNYTSTPSVDTTGVLTLSGGPGAVTVNLAATSVPTGTYRLMHVGSGITDASGFTLGTTPTPTGRQAAGTLGFDSTGNYLTYTISAPTINWTGAQSSEWSTNAITPNQNWELAGPTPTDYQIGDDVAFTDAAVVKTIDISNGDVTPGSVTFNNSTGNDYTITGLNGISGSTALTKNNTGALILTNPNSYTGATTISGGILQLGNGGFDGALGTSSALTVASGATFAVNQSDTVTQGVDFSGAAITGAGGFTQAGSGTTVFTAANSYTGTTVINGGTLQVGNGGTTGALTGTTGITSSGTATLAINRSNAFTQAVDLNGQIITGSDLSLTKAGAGTATLSLANSFGGLTTINGGALSITDAGALGTTNAGIVVNGSNTGSSSNARLELSGGITVSGEAATISGVGSFTGALVGTVGNNIWAGPITIGAPGTRLGANAGSSLEVSGVIDSGVDPHGLVIRTADLTGVVILSGANSYLGNTQVLIGKLQLAGNDDRLPVGTTLTFGSSGTNADAELDLNGTNQEVAGITLTGDALKNSVNNSSLTNSTLTVNTPATLPSTFGGILRGNLALTKTGADTLTLSGANTYTGTTTLNQGTLSLDVTGTLGSATGALVVNNTNTAEGTAVVLNLATGVDATAGSLSGSITPASSGTNTATINIAASRSLTINQTADATYAGAIAGTGSFILGELSTNTLTLSGLSDTDTNNYSGSTVISGGTLALASASNVALAGGLTFGTSAGSASTGNLDLTNASATFGGPFTVQTQNSAVPANTIAIGSGKKLQINGAVNIGTTSGNTTTLLTAAGLGTLSIGDIIAPTNANISVGIGTGDGTRNNSTLDLSGLSAFYANIGSGTFRVGSPTNSSGTGTGTGSTAILAENSTVQAAAITLGSPDGATQSLRLGSGTNVLNTAAITIGTSGRSNANVIFHGETGSVTIRGASGDTSRANLTMTNTSFGTGVSITSTFDTRDHSADLMLGTVLLAQRAGSSTSGTGNAVANFHFNQGTLDADNLTAGSIVSGTAGGNATGTINISGGTATFNSIANPLRLGFNTDDARTARGNLNISGTAAVTVAANGGVSILLGNASVLGGSAIGALSLTGGTLTVAGDIVGGTATGTVTSTILVAGGSLEMGGNDIGASDAAVTLTAESGTLKNVGSINGSGGLTKTTAGTLTLEGANTFSGNTVVSEGTLVLADNASMKFVLGASSGSNNTITGAGTLTLDGDFVIDTTAADELESGSWTLVDHAALTETYATSFTVVGFTDVGDNKWEKTVGTKKYTFDETTGILTSASGASYASWIGGFFPGETDTAIIGANADPDKDGIANAVEMVLGGNPATVMDNALLPTIELVTDPVGSPEIPAGDYMLFTFRRTDLSVAAGLNSGCEVDSDLVGPWTAATSVSGAVIQVDDDFTFTPAAPNTDRVRVYVPRGANMNFGRLNVQTP